MLFLSNSPAPCCRGIRSSLPASSRPSRPGRGYGGILALGLWIGQAASVAPVNDALAQASLITGPGSSLSIGANDPQETNGSIKQSGSSGALNLASPEAGPDLAGLPGGLVPILGANRLPLGEVKLTIRGEPGRAYLIEVSSDLRHWTPVATTLADASGRAYFLDNSSVFVPPPPGEKVAPEHEPSETARPLLFYRAALEKEKPAG